VEQCGLVVKSDRPYIAGSSDRIVSYNYYPKAVLEIKCPFTLADKSVKDGWKHLDYLNMNDKQISETPIVYTIARANGSDTSKNGAFFCVVSKRVNTNHCQL
jgi:hypothetical protein